MRTVRLLREAGLGVVELHPRGPVDPAARDPRDGGPARSGRAHRGAVREHAPARRVRARVASLCLTGPIGDRDPDEARTRIVRRGRCGRSPRRRAPAGVRLGLEPTHASESHESSFLSSIGEAIELLDEAGLDDVGVMVDSVHVWDTPSLEDDIAAAGRRGSRGLHVADKLAPGARGRVLPGEGVTRPERVARSSCSHGLRRLRRRRDLLDPEAFWGLPVDEAARRAYARAGGTTLQAMTSRRELPMTTQQPQRRSAPKDFLAIDHLLDDEERD